MNFAPELQVSQWFNTDKDISLKTLRGKVIFIEAFQMLCPGCVVHGIPLAKMVRHLFSEDQVAVLGLHIVFEHHAAMAPVSLAAFLHEYQINFPVGVDATGSGLMSKTMDARNTKFLDLRQGRAACASPLWSLCPAVQASAHAFFPRQRRMTAMRAASAESCFDGQWRLWAVREDGPIS